MGYSEYCVIVPYGPYAYSKLQCGVGLNPSPRILTTRKERHCGSDGGSWDERKVTAVRRPNVLCPGEELDRVLGSGWGRVICFLSDIMVPWVRFSADI